MTWFRHDCTFSSHPASRAAGLKGRALWMAGTEHCTEHLTDGRIDKHMLSLLAAVAEIGTGRAESRKLVEVGLWIDMGDHWQVPNWDNYQPPRADVEAVKAKRAISGAEGNHKRWHTARGISSPDCPFCDPNSIANASQSATGSGSQTDRHDTTRHDVSDNDHHQLSVVGDQVGTLTARTIAAVADYEVMLAQGRGVVENPPGLRTHIIQRLASEGRIAELAAANPHEMPNELRDWYLEPAALTTYDELVPGLTEAS